VKAFLNYTRNLNKKNQILAPLYINMYYNIFQLFSPSVNLWPNLKSFSVSLISFDFRFDTLCEAGQKVIIPISLKAWGAPKYTESVQLYKMNNQTRKSRAKKKIIKTNRQRRHIRCHPKIQSFKEQRYNICHRPLPILKISIIHFLL
jgi:hypothetical protein